ncbi:uncharacterized protein M6B38_326865 [Iris pallida]|uniref:E3 ubiquitin-protein ligase RMA n=1 Tax=Iris pallida TaxID=29817 RepID=A0AAX6H5E7_IRIPA|nr:uncharacterized protein M6B38_326865 [Iris pallida]
MRVNGSEPLPRPPPDLLGQEAAISGRISRSDPCPHPTAACRRGPRTPGTRPRRTTLRSRARRRRSPPLRRLSDSGGCGGTSATRRPRRRRRGWPTSATGSRSAGSGGWFMTALPTSPGPGPELLTLETAASSHKVVEAPEEEDEGEKSKKVANFECNVCLDLAKEPVVTSCGHLFCWPCLYQWLHVHSEHKECPVCKGEVTESNVTPIYGRGGENKEVVEDGDDPGSAIPPRPRGNRLESFRQKFPPITRRFRAASWRQLVSQQMRSGNPGLFSDGPRHAVLTRLRARRLMGEGLNPENGPGATEETRMPGENTDGVDLWYELQAASRDRLAVLAADIGGRVVSSNNRHGASTSSVDPPSPEREIPRLNVASTSGADQASASSTVAMIQGDAGIADGSTEPDVAGSSRSHRRSYRRRGRSSPSRSLDVDEGVLPARKRRRTD